MTRVRLEEELNVARFREYMARNAALLLASEDAEIQAKGRALLLALLVDPRYQ